MHITSIQYTNEDQTQIKFTLDDGTVMFSSLPNQTWYGPYIQQYISNGNVIEDYVPPPPAVERIPKLRIVDNIIEAGKITEALALINSDPIMKARWDAAVDISTDDPTANALIQQLGLDPEVILA